MKKQLFTILCLLSASMLFAQKQQAKSFTLETQLFMPGNNSAITSITPNIRLRYFYNPSIAFRIQGLFTSDNNENRIAENPDGTGASGSDITLDATYSFSMGMEKHFQGTSKFSPYIGILLQYTGRTVTQDYTNYNGALYVDKYKINMDGALVDIAKGGTYTGPRSGYSLGPVVVAGADYYITPSIYLGAEIGYGFFMTKTTEVTMKVTQTNGDINTLKWLKGSNNALSFANSGLRIGIVF